MWSGVPWELRFLHAPGVRAMQLQLEASGLKLEELVGQAGLWVRRPGLKPQLH